MELSKVAEPPKIRVVVRKRPLTQREAFDYDANNQVIYDHCVLPLVAETFKGNKTTCFAYGQTGSGKTFTMMGT